MLPPPPPSENAGNHARPKVREEAAFELNDQWQQVADLIGKVAAIGRTHSRQVPTMRQTITTAGSDGSQEDSGLLSVIQAHEPARKLAQQASQRSLDVIERLQVKPSGGDGGGGGVVVVERPKMAQSFASNWWWSDKSNIIIMMKMLHVVCRLQNLPLFAKSSKGSTKDNRAGQSARWLAMASITIIWLCASASISSQSGIRIPSLSAGSSRGFLLAHSFDASQTKFRKGKSWEAKELQRVSG